MQYQEVIFCPVCGGQIKVQYDDKVNRCEYCGSPVLGPSQDRDCVNHPNRLAKAVCHVCGDLICEECKELRVGDYGGKLLTIVNCKKPRCVAESSWARERNEEYERLANMDWADKVDNRILRITGLGAVLMMIFEMVLILTILSIQWFTPWGIDASNMPFWIVRGDQAVVFGVLGNLLAAMLLQTALQVYVHERQLGSGAILLVLLIIEMTYLLLRGLHFNLLFFPNPMVPLFLLAAFLFSSFLVFIGSLGAIRIGYKKHRQLKNARARLGLQV